MHNVLYGGDRLTLRGIYLSMRSMLEHNKMSFHFYILTMEVKDKGIKGKAILEDDRILLEKMAKRFNNDNLVELFDFTEEYQKTIAKTPNHKCSYSPYCMLRLFSEDILPNENVLYLDADTLINGSLDDLFAKDISELELLAGLDYLGQWWVHPGYFNSGVMFLNGTKIKENHLFKRAIEMLMHKRLFFADQSAINNLVSAYQYLPRKYNDQRAVHNDSIICHFCKRIYRFWKPIRPWNIKEMRETFKIKNFDKTYIDYLDEFSFEKIGLERPTYKI